MTEGKPRNIRDLLKVTSDYLKQKNIESPRLSAEVLLAHLLKLTRVQLYLHFDQPLSEDELAGYRALIKRRLKREPLQYITGSQEFWSLDFEVNSSILIPRPESELLVEKSLSLFRERRLPNSDQPRLLDLCTGSGALAVAVASEIQTAEVWASDTSEEALKLARSNAIRHKVEHRIMFLLGDLWEPVGEKNLVSNPPYIRSDAFEGLSPEVRLYEPRLALDGGEEGMVYIEKILLKGPDYLRPGGWILVEMDPEQTAKAMEWMEETGRYEECHRVKDYSHRYRVVAGRKKTRNLGCLVSGRF
jgi:release factor glutamine methyltransferase